MSGYDKENIKEISKLTSSQITFCGGASSYKNVYDILSIWQQNH